MTWLTDGGFDALTPFFVFYGQITFGKDPLMRKGRYARGTGETEGRRSPHGRKTAGIFDRVPLPGCIPAPQAV